MIGSDGDARSFLAELFAAAAAAAHPALAVPAHLPPRPRGRTIVVGAGKASAQMALALDGAWDGPLSGAVVTRYGYGCAGGRVDVLEAAHPVPDAAGLAAARRMVELVASAGPDDLVIALMSGGGSALLPAPPPGLDLVDERALNAALLRSGAPIGAMNAVRKHCSTIKGGRLAAASRAPVASLILSDIPGDVPHLVASGPTVPDGATRADALRVVAEYRLDLPHRVSTHLASPAASRAAARRPALRRPHPRHRRLGRDLARRRRGRGGAAGRAGRHPVRRHRGRGARHRPRACRPGARGGDARPALRQAGCDPLRRRDHRDDAGAGLRRPRAGARRAQRGVPAVLRAGGRRPAGHRRARRRHGRHRRLREQRRRLRGRRHGGGESAPRGSTRGRCSSATTATRPSRAWARCSTRGRPAPTSTTSAPSWCAEDA